MSLSEQLQFRVSHLADGALVQRTLDEQEAAELIDAEGDLAPRGPLELDLQLTPMTSGAYLRGSINGAFACPCVRCLEDVAIDVNVNVSSTFLPYSDEKGGADDEMELEADDLDLSFYDDDTVDLGVFIRETLLLELPAYPLCDEDCQGLCNSCGANLNTAPCDCEPPIDPRLEGLRALKAKLSD